MAISTSTNLGLTLPGSTTHDERLADIQAVKSALVTIDSAVANVIATNANIGGSSDINFATKNLTPSGHIIPLGNKTQNIGSPTNRFKALYVDEAYLSVNTLYLGDTAVMGTEQDIINIKADLNQSINVKTTGVGNTYITSEHGVELSTTGPSSDVLVQATGAGGQVRFTANQAINLTAPSVNIYGESAVSGNQNIGGTLTVNGSLIVNGTTTTVNSTTVSTTDNIIEVNKGQVGSGVSAGKAGLTVNRGDEPSYQMVFDETDDMFKVGMAGSLQTIASQNFVNTTSAPIVHTHNNASTVLAGFMSPSDKTKLDGAALVENTYTQAQVQAMIAASLSEFQNHLYSFS